MTKANEFYAFDDAKQVECTNMVAYTARVKAKECPARGLVTDPEALKAVLKIGVAAAKLMDLARKAVIYGKEIEADDLLRAVDAIHASCDTFDGALLRDTGEGYEGEAVPVDFRLLHSIMGNFGEAGEKFELLLDQIANNGKLNALQMILESGDSAFWTAVEEDRIGELTGVSPSGIRAANMAKLDKRVKGAFNPVEFLNRDTAAEDAAAAAALEGKAA